MEQFPIKPAQEEQQLASKLADHANDNNNGNNEDDEDPNNIINICLLDGTWSQAKHLNNRLPKHVPRIKLSTVQEYKPLFDALRKQSMKGRISTFEAAVMCMKELGETEDTCTIFMNNLKAMILELRKQCKKDGKPMTF